MERYAFTSDHKDFMESMQIPFAVFQLVDQRIVTLAVSDGFCELLGCESRAQAYLEMDGDTYRNVHPDDVARVANAVLRFMKEGGRLETIYRLKKNDGPGYRLIHAYGRHVFTRSGTRLAHIWYADEGDYTEGAVQQRPDFSKALSNAIHEESILKASYYDYLTGLPSMTRFFELAEAGKDAICQAGGSAALLFVDLNGMKFFNQKHGFTEGDKYLQAFAKLLGRLFNSENCCRIGQDHFGVFTEEAGLEAALERLFEESRALFGHHALPVRVGIYTSRHEDVPVSTACDRAKIACDAIRGTYVSGFNYYSQALSEEAARKQYVVENLDRAIGERWIQVYYQPIVRAVNEKVCDEEALARWIDPERGFMSPADFIPALEDSGLIYKLDLCVLEQVLEKMRRQKALGLHVVPHSINLSRSDFDACDIVEEILRRVDAAGIERDRITVEVTESVVGSDVDFMKAQIERFQALGFPVWMDDFGSGYSSLDLLQTVKFDLIKFDMSFMRKLDAGNDGRIILTEMMKMATSLGLDTVCEGVETEGQVRFLQEIGCAKLQGFYFCKPQPFEAFLERNRRGEQFGYENPEETSYYEAIGCVNLYDLGVIANVDDSAFQNAFNTVPMGIIEIRGDTARFMRSNQSYRDFVKRFFGLDLSYQGASFNPYYAPFMSNIVRTCCEQGNRAFYDEQMGDGSIVHSFARRIGVNPVSGNVAVAVAVLSISEPNEGASYADIARALAADYYNIYVVDLDTERFIEYTSPIGGEEPAVERHGENFFAEAKRDAMTRIYEEDRGAFFSMFSKEKVAQELNEQGAFTATYRLMDTGKPMYANLKITRMAPGGNRIIMGVSIVDAQLKRQDEEEKLRQERVAFGRIAALSGNYVVIYSVNPETGRYVECSASTDYVRYGFAREGEDFFRQVQLDAPRAVDPADLPRYLRAVTAENLMGEISRHGLFALDYRLVMGGASRPVSLRAAMVREEDGDKLIVGVNSVDA